MHRRARHLNQRDAGAILVLDSRRIYGLSDGSSISQWNDVSRSGANATQSTSTIRPIYKTAIQGGQPVVRFNVANNYLATTVTSSFGFIFCIANISSNTQDYAGILTARTSPNSALVSASSANCVLTTMNAPSPRPSQRITGATGNPVSLSSVYDRGVAGSVTDMENFDNGLLITAPFMLSMTSVASVSGTNNFTIGRDTYQTANPPRALSSGDILVVSLLPQNIGSPLRRRVEQSAAFSFKIQCS